MFFFAKTKKTPGWMAISLQNDGIYAAHVVRPPADKPVVERAAFFPSEKPADKGLLEKLAKELGLARYQCSNVLASGEYQLLSIDAPNVPKEELKTAVRWRLKDILDFSVDQATIDVLDVPVDSNGASRAHSMYAVAARNELIRSRQEMFSEARIPLSVIDIPEMAQRNISEMLGEDGRGIAMLSFSDKEGLLTVTYSGELYLSRRIELPLSQLELPDLEQRNACYERITLELQRSLDHFDRQYHFISLSRLLLAPLGEAAQPLCTYMASNLYVPAEVFDLGSVLDLSKAPDLQQPEMQRRYFMTLGAALRQQGGS